MIFNIEERQEDYSMTGTQLNILGISIGLAVSIAGLIFVMVSPKTNSTQFYLSNTEKLSPGMVKFVDLFGGDVLSLFPAKAQKKSISNKEINDLFQASGNPWEVTKLDFFALRVSYGFAGIIVGIAFSFLAGTGLLFGMLITAFVGYFGWNRPVSVYKGIAEDREKDFLKHFPEMLDYLTMIMSNTSYTYTLGNAIEVSLQYLPESAVKFEFTRVVDSINAGMSTDLALKSLANRLPSPALQSFVNAVNNANKLNAPMNDLMAKRAKKSREDILNDMELQIQALPTKTMLTVAPASIISMLVIFMVPVVFALLSTI